MPLLRLRSSSTAMSGSIEPAPSSRCQLPRRGVCRRDTPSGPEGPDQLPGVCRTGRTRYRPKDLTGECKALDAALSEETDGGAPVPCPASRWQRINVSRLEAKTGDARQANQAPLDLGTSVSSDNAPRRDASANKTIDVPLPSCVWSRLQTSDQSAATRTAPSHGSPRCRARGAGPRRSAVTGRTGHRASRSSG
jgi:hypothetical protein